jgi:hypothetical protein
MSRSPRSGDWISHTAATLRVKQDHQRAEQDGNGERENSPNHPERLIRSPPQKRVRYDTP